MPLIMLIIEEMPISEWNNHSIYVCLFSIDEKIPLGQRYDFFKCTVRLESILGI